MKITGSKAIVLSLLQEGVDLIFGYPGGAIMPTYDALYDAKDRLRHVLVRHEQGAVHAAEGYARVSGKVGVCLATSGPGATNLVTGIADAMLDSVPLVCITGQVTSSFLGTDAFQETDILSITAAITKWSCQVTSAEQIPFSIAKAFHIAKNGRPGPVLIDITKDAQFGLLEFSYPSFNLETAVQDDKAMQNFELESLPMGADHSQMVKAAHVGKDSSSKGCVNLTSSTAVSRFNDQRMNVPCMKLDSNLVKEAAELINQASKPYLLVGHGVQIAGAEKELLSLAEKAGIPVACTLLGLSAFPTRHPLYVGMLGMHGNYGPNVLTNEADVIVAVGMRFDDRVTGCLKNYAKQAKIVHIEIDDAEINKNVKVTVPLLADAKLALQELLPYIKAENHPLWLEKFKQCAELEFKEVVEKEIHPSEGHIKMAEVIHNLSTKNNRKAIIVSDVGQHQMVTARYHAFAQTNSHITSGGLGTMGFALPAAIGAKLAAMNRQVIAVIGDGGFQMNIQELGVISQEHLPVKIVILNNQYLGMVRQWQELFFESRYSCTEMHNPDFVKIAEGYGIRARKVVDRSQLNEALDEMLEANEAYLLEIVVEKQHKVFPMIPSGASVSEVRLK